MPFGQSLHSAASTRRSCCSERPCAHISVMAFCMERTSSCLSCRTATAVPWRHSVPLRARCVAAQVHGSPQAQAAPSTHCSRRMVSAHAAAAEVPSAASKVAEPSVEEVMNPNPVVLRDSEPIKEAVHKMLQADVSGCPVVNEQGQLVGVLSESDLIWKGAGAPQDHFIIPPIFLGFADAYVYLRDNKQFEDEVHKILAKTVADAMSHQVLSVKPDLPMSEAAQIMLQKQVNLLPVEQDGQVVGVLTRHDVLRGIYASKSPFL